MYSSRRDGRSPTNSGIRRSSPASTSRGDADPAATVAAAEDAFGPVSVLVNNAGIGRVGSIEETEPKAWRQVIDINLTGMHLGIRAVASSMRKADGRLTQGQTHGYGGAVVLETLQINCAPEFRDRLFRT